VVFTRTWLAKKSLSNQFRHHSTHRRYLAIADGDVPTQTIRSHLVENRGDGLRGSVEAGRPRAIPPGARLAITHVERVEALQGATLIACTLETGRTHQIRIHLSEAGHPLVGERVYIRDAASPSAPIAAPRLMLHAAELGFVHPATERSLRFEEPIPDDMREILERLRR
jgi:23S rRNA pseudouridine1911/1915/1917 synthase